MAEPNRSAGTYTLKDVVNGLQDIEGKMGGGTAASGLVVDAPFVDEDTQFVADNASEIVDAFKSGRNVVIHFIANETSAGFGFKCDAYFTVAGYKEADDMYPANFFFGDALSYYGPGITDWGIEDNKLKFSIYID